MNFSWSKKRNSAYAAYHRAITWHCELRNTAGPIKPCLLKTHSSPSLGAVQINRDKVIYVQFQKASIIQGESRGKNFNAVPREILRRGFADCTVHKDKMRGGENSLCSTFSLEKKCKCLMCPSWNVSERCLMDQVIKWWDFPALKCIVQSNSHFTNSDRFLQITLLWPMSVPRVKLHKITIIIVSSRIFPQRK